MSNTAIECTLSLYSLSCTSDPTYREGSGTNTAESRFPELEVSNQI